MITSDICRFAAPAWGRGSYWMIPSGEARLVVGAGSHVRHPAGASKMGLPSPARTPRLPPRIDAQNNAGNVLAVGTLSVGVEQAQVRYRVPLVIRSE